MATSSNNLPDHYSAFDDRNFQIGGRTLFFTIVIFSIIVTVTLIFLLARWLLRLRSPSLPVSSSHEAHAPAREARGMAPGDVGKIPITLYRSSGEGVEESGECSICLGAFEEGEKVKVLRECSHCYHHECLDRWLVDRSSCPLCRSDLRFEPVGPEAITVEIISC